MTKKILMLVTGVLILSLGTVICMKTTLGIDPFNAFCIGVSRTIGFNLGPTALVINIILIAFILLLKRSLIGIATVFIMFFLGYIISFFEAIIPDIAFPFLSILNIAVFVIGMFFTCFGAAVYFESMLGMAPYDSIAFVVADRLGGKTFVYRVILDCSVALIALLLGGPISLGTIILAFGLGPIIDFFRFQVVNKYIKKSDSL